MTDPDAIRGVLLDWASGTDPDAQCLLLMTTPEIITLHYLLALLQWMLEQSDPSNVDMVDLSTLRKNVEGILVKAGYGGDPRP